MPLWKDDHPINPSSRNSSNGEQGRFAEFGHVRQQAGPPFPWRNRETPVSFATLPEKSLGAGSDRKPVPFTAPPKFSIARHPSRNQ